MLNDDVYVVLNSCIMNHINSCFSGEDIYSLYYISPQNISIKNLIISINDIDILNKVILISIRNKDLWFLRDIFNEKILLHPYYSYHDI